ncbi:MAG TPA: uracil-DNA glycosylase [Chloroflexia bacterium]|nr:uracil-DNA glycosylase [Chloroflexia bacterium]
MAEGGRGAASISAGMKELEAQVRTCQLCRLAKTRTNAVPGEGNIRAEVMFIGEGPGYHADKQGRPCVVAAVQFLNELLQIAGLSRESVYIANVVKCRPPNNRDPEPDEKAACAPYLERQIALINPRVIVTLGRHSMAGFFPGERISQIHGTASVVDGRLCVAMYHPAAGLHQASLADIIRADFRKLPIYLEQAQLMASPPKEVVREQVTQAESARESVIHKEETATVLEAVTEPEVAAVAEAPEAYSPTPEPEQPAVEQAIPAPVQAIEKAKAPSRARKPRATKEEYKQLSFFDL